MSLLDKLNSRPGLIKASIALGALLFGLVIASPFYFGRPAAGGAGVNQAWPILATHDLIQHIAVMEDFDKVLRSGVLYPRWLPDINNGYGIPWMNFYPPGFYYLASLLHFVIEDWIEVLFVASVLGFAASGLAFYMLARVFYSRAASIIAGLLYMALPYHVLNLYWLGAMPQFLGFIFLPLVLYFAYKVGELGRGRDYAGIGLCYGLYLLTHAPVSFLMTYVIAFYGVAWAARQRDWKIALRIALGMVLGLLVGAIYLMPAALETKDIQEHFSSLFHYHYTYITLFPLDGFGNLVNQSFVGLTLLLIASIIILRESTPAAETESSARAQTRMWVVMGIITTFMCTSFSIHISKLLPKIQVATFAWRWLAIASLFASLLVAAAIDRLRFAAGLEPLKFWACRAMLGAALIFNIWNTVQGVIIGAFSNPPHNQPAVYVEAGFTPAGSTHPEYLPATEAVTLIPEAGASEVIRWEPNRRSVVVSAQQPLAMRLKTYNFPGWTATVDGKPVTISSDSDGVQLIPLESGQHRVETTFGSTTPRTLGTALAVSGLLLILGLGVVDIKRRRNAGGENEEKISAERGKRARAVALSGAIDSAHAEYVQERTPARLNEEKNRAFSQKKILTLVGILAVTGVLVVFMATRLFKSEDKPSTGGDAPARSEARLQLDGRDRIMVSVDEAALNELMGALASKDEGQIERLVESGKVFAVRNNTSVRVLEVGFAKSKVRIIEGDEITKEGWVPDRWIR